MTDKRRNVGPEILDGIRQLKRGARGRVTNVEASSAMKRDKKRRLERAGWTIGDAVDFLGPPARKARPTRLPAAHFRDSRRERSKRKARP
jgi:hypothetical protein